MAIDKVEAARLLQEVGDRIVLIRELVRKDCDPHNTGDQAFASDLLVVGTGIVRLQKRCET